MQSIDLLRSYDIPDAIIDIWRKRGIETLIPFQAAAIKKHRIPDGENLLVSAPTSSGKTLLGEIATIKAALKTRKTLYLVPLKALAEEKFSTFKTLGESSGLRVAISTRDRHDFDKDIIRGNFHIAVIVYEKFLHYLQSEIKFLHQFGLIVMDELQLISDPDRGARIEIILSRLKQLSSGPQFLGLSAVLPADSLFASWLKMPVLHELSRPIELRMGYLEDGDYHYWSSENGFSSIEEEFTLPGGDKQETLLNAVAVRAVRDEQSIVFVPDRRSTRYLALLLADFIRVSPDFESPEQLEEMEETVSRDELITVLRKRVAFHNADLLPEERKIVETAFREGRTKVIIATTTLAMGVNLPAKNVFVPPEKWLSLPGVDRPFLSPLKKSEFVNMGGRAGRLHLNDDFGRAIMLTDSLIEREQFRQGIIEEEIEEFEPWLLRNDLDTTVLATIGINAAESNHEIVQFLTRSYSAFVDSARGVEQDYDAVVEKSVQKLLRGKLLRLDKHENLRLTRAGEVAVKFGLSARTGAFLARLIQDDLHERIDVLSASFMVLATREGITAAANLSSNEMSTHGSYYLSEITDTLSYVTVDWLQQESGISSNPWDWVRISKSALLLKDFVGGYGNREIEQRYNTYFGAIARLGEQVAWLLEASAAMIPEKRKDDNLLRRLTSISTQVRYGVPRDVAFLAQANIAGLGRERLNALARFGVSSWDTLAEVEISDLERMTTPKIAQTLSGILKRREANRSAEAAEHGPMPVLKMVGKAVGRRSTAEIHGEPVYIRDRDFEVLLRLALARTSDSEGWLDRFKLGFTDGSITQGISRIRETLRAPSQDPDGWIESDGSGHYRLKLEGSQIEIDRDTLSRHWSSTVQQLIADPA